MRLLCDIAADNGLLVWLHVGPFIDKRMDFGGMPWWLFKNKNIRVRTLQQSFMDRVGRTSGHWLQNSQVCGLAVAGLLHL